MNRSIRNLSLFTGKSLVLLLVLASLLLAGCHTSRQTQLPAYENSGLGEFAPHTLIIYYDTQTGSQELLEAAKRIGCEIVYTYQIIPAVALRVPERMPIDEAMRFFRQVKGVTQVNRDRINRLHQ